MSVLEMCGSLGFLQVVQKSKQWWLVSNARDEEGHVPQNVLEPMKSEGPMEELLVSSVTRIAAEEPISFFHVTSFLPFILSAQQRDNRGPVTLNMTSTPSEVKAWLQYKGFNKM